MKFVRGTDFTLIILPVNKSDLGDLKTRAKITKGNKIKLKLDSTVGSLPNLNSAMVFLDST